MNNLTLLAFDTDGVFENLDETSSYVSGPVKVEWVDKLEKEGYIITIVSPSPFYPKDKAGFAKFLMCGAESSNTMRWKNLEISKRLFKMIKHKQPKICLYISDNGDWKEAQKAGFIYVDAKMFANAFKENIS